MIEFSNTNADFEYNSANSSGAFVGYTAVSKDQNITLANTRQMTASTNGTFSINCSMSTSNSHVSPVIDLDRMSVITIDNDIDDAVISANDITVTVRGSGYTNTAVGATTATISAPDRSGGVTATANVLVDVTLTLSTANDNCLLSANGGYTANSTTPGQFVIGEGVRTVASSSDAGAGSAVSAGSQITATVSGTDNSHLSDDKAAVGLITVQTFVGGDPSNNVASITIRTAANNMGVFANGTYIVADTTAQSPALTNSGKSAASNTFAIIKTTGEASSPGDVAGVTGHVASILPWPTNATSGSPTGSGYLTSPTITISGPFSGTSGASAIVTGEDSASGGNINTRYISRRVTLEDGFDATDLKVIINAYKPLDTWIEVYFKVKADEDPQDFDEKGYTLMTQETSNSVFSLSEEDTKEFVYQSANESIEYTSGGVKFDRFKTFAIKIALTSTNAAVVPKVRDMRAIALDT